MYFKNTYFWFNVLGWTAVDEYLSDEIASNSEDEKRIRQANQRASRKKRMASKNPKPAKRYHQAPHQAPYPSDNFSSSNFFRGFMQPRRFQAGASTSSWGYGPKPTDLCYACGKAGHWRRNCPQFSASRASSATFYTAGNNTK